ncbi:hypothetical protein FOMPIDRAFT_1051663 [Fomitopsis schrenkii]|uniref:DUF6699 domain-containing protein n=1 Tax=Fomitopsis schrenkii TaxID=2126942 RepID=S8E4J6_FOMSC|nr:hypothetical protein FOMPIDRAFT_1051663 [Fomitopsis schrenkii]
MAPAPHPATYTGTYGSRVAPLPPVTPRCLPSEIEDSCHRAWSFEKRSCSVTAEVASILSRAYKAEPVRLKWDMAYPLAQSFDRKVKLSTPSSLGALREPALSTTTVALIVVLVGSPYPYEILVKPSSDSSTPSYYVTALDVLREVYASLNMIVSAGEMITARKRSDVWTGASAAYVRRTGGNPKEPLKRIDFLAGRTVFYGMAHVGLAGKLPKLELLVGHRPSS